LCNIALPGSCLIFDRKCPLYVIRESLTGATFQSILGYSFQSSNVYSIDKSASSQVLHRVNEVRADV